MLYQPVEQAENHKKAHADRQLKTIREMTINMMKERNANGINRRQFLGSPPGLSVPPTKMATRPASSQTITNSYRSIT
jgi:hypothetical protein